MMPVAVQSKESGGVFSDNTTQQYDVIQFHTRYLGKNYPTFLAQISELNPSQISFV